MSHFRPAPVPRRTSALLAAAAGAALVLATALPAEATSWVRGRGGINPGATVDPLFQADPPEVLIPTVSTGQFNAGQKGFFSQADLGNGKLRARAFVNGGSGNAFGNPVMGDTVSFRNDTGEPQSFDFTYAIDGHVTTGDNPFPITQTFPGVGTFRTTAAQFSLSIFAPRTVGPAGSDNAWNTMLDQALFGVTKDVAGFPTSGTIQSFDQDLNDSISGSLPLELGLNEFDVVLLVNALVNIPQGFDSSIDMDFSNTAALQIDSPVPFESDSGVFLTGMNRAVSEPAGLAMFGLVAVVGLARRRRGATAA